MTPTLTSEVWLIKSRTNPFPVKGEMALTDGTVAVTITDGASCIESMRAHLEDTERDIRSALNGRPTDPVSWGTVES